MKGLLLLRTLSLAVALQLIIGIIADCIRDELPVRVIFGIYSVLGGVPLIILLTLTISYGKNIGAHAVVWKSLSTLKMLATAISLSGILWACIRLLTSGALKFSLPYPDLSALTIYFIVGGAMYGLALFLERLRSPKS